MAVDIKVTNTHAVCFPSKLVAGNGGQHIYNLYLTADRDNGVIRSLGAWKEFEVYTEGNAPTSFAGVIRAKSARGYWYVEITEPADAVLVLEVEDTPGTNYDKRFTDSKAFYNASGSTVRAYGLIKHDIFEISEEGFSGTPAAGSTVTANATTGKLVVGS